MPHDFTSHDLLHALLDDFFVSFNINRSEENRTARPRRVVALPAPLRGGTVIPGVRTGAEKDLLHELERRRGRRRLRQHSFTLDRRLFSLLWRFRSRDGRVFRHLRGAVPLGPRQAAKVRKALKRHRDSLAGGLRPGSVFLIPDNEVLFNDPGRVPRPYARPVLVFHAGAGQVMFIPFSSQVNRMDPKTDILFDPAFREKCLDPAGLPATEKFTLKFASGKSALVVHAAQSMSREAFLASALARYGTVRRAVVNFIRQRMKNLAV